MAAHPTKCSAKIGIIGDPLGLRYSSGRDLCGLNLRLLPRKLSGLRCCWAIIRRKNLHHYEFRMRFRPGQSLPLGFKKTIDHECTSLESCPASATGSFTLDHSAAGIDRGEDAVREDDFAAIRNPARVDRAMSNPQSHASGAFVPPRIPIRTTPAAGPVNRHSGQQ